MRCFNHAEDRAVGICKTCGKGLCHNCLKDSGHGLACKDNCEKHLTELTNSINQLHKLETIPFIVAGAGFLGGGIFYACTSGLSSYSIFFIMLGLACISWFLIQKRIKK